MFHRRGTFLMVGEPLADAAIFILILFFSACISSFEAALQSVSRQQLEDHYALSDLRAQLALVLKSNAERLRATSKYINVFALVFNALLIAPYVQLLVGYIAGTVDPGVLWITDFAEVVSVILLSGIIAVAYLATVTLAGRSYGHAHAVTTSLRSARFMKFLVKVFAVPTSVTGWLANLIAGGGEKKTSFIDSVMSEESLKDMLEEGTKSGFIDETEHELIESIFDFTETTAKEIMLPRTAIIAIEKGMSPDDILRVVVEEGFTRMPVYDESIDNIVGIIYAKDVLSLVQHSDLIILDDIIRPPFYVPETKPISELLRDFQRKHQHLAIVVDEFGGTEGLITMEDILEEIVGEIQDEYDEEEPLVEKMPDGIYVVQALLNISEFNDIADFEIPESEDYDTIGGFVTSLFGRIPHEGEELRYHDIDITVLQVEERRIVTVRFMQRPDDSSGEDFE